MNGRQKLEAALSPQGSPEFGIGLCYKVLVIRDLWDQLTPCPWWYRFSPDFENQMAWRRDVTRAMGDDWFDLRDAFKLSGRRLHRVEALGNEAWKVFLDDGRREPLTKPLTGGWHQDYSRSPHPLHLPDTTDDLDRIIGLSPAFDPSTSPDDMTDVSAAMLHEFGPSLLPTGYAQSPLSMCYNIWGFEGMMVMIAEQPDLVRYACERFLTNQIVNLNTQAVQGICAIWIEEVLTDMISPAAYEALCTPYAQQLVDHVHSLGMHSIYYYCGNPHGKLDRIIQTGAHCIGLEEGKKGFTIDIDDIVDAVAGRCCLLGNVDAINLLPHASNAELEMEIKRQISAGRRNKNRFIMGIGSPVTPETPLTRVRQFCDLTHELGAR